MSIKEQAQRVLATMPPETRFNAADQAAFAKHSALMASWEDTVVQVFYDTLYAHGETRAIFHDGERPAREEMLRGWWRRTTAKPIDDSYWEWMTQVGLVHIVRRVTNPMMLGMWDLVIDLIRKQSSAQLSADDANALTSAWTRLAATVGALIGESYLDNYLACLESATGMSRTLMETMAMNEIQALLDAARAGR